MVTFEPTSKVIEKYCLKNDLRHELDILPNDTRLHWIGRCAKEKRPLEVVLYIHGGGYTNSANAEHVEFARKCALEADASLVMLEYTLAPTGRFPTQLNQAVEALKHILTFTPASKVYIAGESAGAHLAISLLSHIMHPSEGIKAIKVSGLGGMCLISPFVSFDYDKNSYKDNAAKDYLSARQLKDMFSSNFKTLGLTEAQALKDPRLSPLDAPAGWWKGCPVERILITMGTDEVLLDDIHAFWQILKAETKSTTYVEVAMGRREVHASCLLGTFLKKEDEDTWNEIMKWMRTRY
jgi:acetyl esterase/lipase